MRIKNLVRLEDSIETQSTASSGSYILNIPSSDIPKLNIGDPITIIGAGSSHGLDKPTIDLTTLKVFVDGKSVIIDPTLGSTVREYKIVSISEGLGISETSDPLILPNTPNQLNEQTYIQFSPERMEGAYQFLLYGRVNPMPSDPFKFVGSIVANPYGTLLKHIDVDDDPASLRDSNITTIAKRWFFRDTSGEPGFFYSGSEPTRVRHTLILPIYVPDELPIIERNNCLRTRITAKDRKKSQVSIKDPTTVDITNALLFHDNSLALEEAICANVSQTLKLPSGTYKICGNLYINHKIDLVGQGIAKHDVPGTTLQFSQGFGVVIWEKADFSSIDQMTLESKPSHHMHGLVSGGLVLTPDKIHGSGLFIASPSVQIRNVRIREFNGNGVTILGSTSSTRNNANHILMYRCMARSNQCHGVQILGNDANAFLIQFCDSSTNRGWGFIDDSRLGGTFVSCHTNDNKMGPYRISKAQTSSLIGCYSEEGQPPSHTSGSQQTILGGTHGAGFTADSAGLFLLNRKEVGAFQIRQGNASISIGRQTESSSSAIETNLSDVPRTFLKYNVLKRTQSSEALDNDISWNQNTQRIHFRHSDHSNKNTGGGFTWTGSDVRGRGLLAFNRKGFLIGQFSEFYQEDKTYDNEKRISGRDLSMGLEHGLYDKGDIILDLSGKDILLQPKERFGVGGEWSSLNETQVGTVIEAEGMSYVVRYIINPHSNFTSGKTIAATSDIEPFSSHYLKFQRIFNGDEYVIDREIVWRKIDNVSGSHTSRNPFLVVCAEEPEGEKLIYVERLGKSLLISTATLNTVQTVDLLQTNPSISNLDVYIVKIGPDNKVDFSAASIPNVESARGTYEVFALVGNNYFSGSKGNIEPDWSFIGNDGEQKFHKYVADNHLLWMLWGTAGSDGKTTKIGRRRTEVTLPGSGLPLDIPPQTTFRFTITLSGAEPRESINVSPTEDVPDGLFWNAYIKAADEVLLRITNVTSSEISIEAMTWVFECFKH